MAALSPLLALLVYVILTYASIYYTTASMFIYSHHMAEIEGRLTEQFHTIILTYTLPLLLPLR